MESAWTPQPALTLAAGATWAQHQLARNSHTLSTAAETECEKCGLGPGSYLSPYLSLRFSPIRNHSLQVSTGRTHQFPFFHELFGRFGDAGLNPESADVIQGRWSYRSQRGNLVDFSAYHRRRGHIPWRNDRLWRLVDGKIQPPGQDTYSNLLQDRSSGAALQVIHHSPTGLSGRIGYAWGRSEWSDQDRVWFPGNYDQRHSFLLLAGYRWTSELEMSLRWRYGSGLPVPLYARRDGDRYFVASERNRIRSAAYSRMDVRLARAFNRDHFRLTLFLEVLNLLNRRNERFSGFDADAVNPVTGELHRFLQRQFPLLPTAGLVAEF